MQCRVTPHVKRPRGGLVPTLMGCGALQRASPVEVNQPLARDGRHQAASQRPTNPVFNSPEAFIGSSRSGRDAPRESPVVDGHRGMLTDASRQAAQGQRGAALRFMVQDRVTLTRRLPPNIQDHAYCFQCGVFFFVGGSRVSACPNCSGGFIQYMRSAADPNWISAESARAGDFAFDDQLVDSITASLNETPAPKRPTQVSFLSSLPSQVLDKEEVAERALLDASDPRCNCAICRDTFIEGDELKMLPCHHEFHADCILLWLKGQNTCPICRWRLPEGAEDEEPPEQDAKKLIECTERPYLEAHRDDGLETPRHHSPESSEEDDPPGSHDATSPVVVVVGVTKPAEPGDVPEELLHGYGVGSLES